MVATLTLSRRLLPGIFIAQLFLTLDFIAAGVLALLFSNRLRRPQGRSGSMVPTRPATYAS